MGRAEKRATVETIAGAALMALPGSILFWVSPEMMIYLRAITETASTLILLTGAILVVIGCWRLLIPPSKLPKLIQKWDKFWSFRRISVAVLCMLAVSLAGPAVYLAAFPEIQQVAPAGTTAPTTIISQAPTPPAPEGDPCKSAFVDVSGSKNGTLNMNYNVIEGGDAACARNTENYNTNVTHNVIIKRPKNP